MINQKESKMQFIQYPLSSLKSAPTPHPEVVNPRCAFDLMCRRVHLKRENAVITREGQPLAFLMADISWTTPEPPVDFIVAPFNKTCLRLSWLEAQAKPVLCSRRKRPWFWLVPPSYQQWLDLPVLEEVAN